MIRLGYSTSSLTNLDLSTAIRSVKEAGYSDVELSFHKKQFNPFEISYHDLTNLKKELKQNHITAACVSPPTFFFESTRPHDPSMMCVDLAGRKQRIHLIKKAIEIAKILEAPIVNFGSGFLRDDHALNPSIDPQALLIDSIHQCLEDIEDVILTIEPEPGMYIENLEQGVNLIKKVNSKNFQLQIDLCHAFCSEKNYIEAIREAAPYTKYLHVADTTDGCNVKVIHFKEGLQCNLDFASYLIYFPQTADFLFVDQKHAFYFYDDPLTGQMKRNIEKIAHEMNACEEVRYIDYNSLYMGKSIHDSEIFTYAISIPHINFHVIQRIKPIIHFLRTTSSPETGTLILQNKVANTLTGKVHYHEVPGRGQIDFSACFKALNDCSYEGSAILELYHNVEDWQEALHESFRFLSQNMQKAA